MNIYTFIFIADDTNTFTSVLDDCFDVFDGVSEGGGYEACSQGKQNGLGEIRFPISFISCSRGVHHNKLILIIYLNMGEVKGQSGAGDGIWGKKWWRK